MSPLDSDNLKSLIEECNRHPELQKLLGQANLAGVEAVDVSMGWIITGWIIVNSGVMERSEFEAMNTMAAKVIAQVVKARQSLQRDKAN